MELLKNTVIEKDFERVPQSILVQVTENCLTGFDWDKFCVLTAALASSLGNRKGERFTVPIVSEGLKLLKKEWRLCFDSLIAFKKIIEVEKLDAGKSMWLEMAEKINHKTQKFLW